MVFAAACIIGAPGNIQAYYTTAQEAQLLREDTALYSITYRFGLKDEPIWLPVFAERDLAFNSDAMKAGYQFIVDEETTLADGLSAGFVTSDATMQDGLYYVPAGEVRFFTLHVLLQVPSDYPETDDVALNVSELPFYVGEDRRYERLNPPELQYYTTPEVDLNEYPAVRTSGSVNGPVMKITLTK